VAAPGSCSGISGNDAGAHTKPLLIGVPSPLKTPYELVSWSASYHAGVSAGSSPAVTASSAATSAA
jgi:hypothetical protein